LSAEYRFSKKAPTENMVIVPIIAHTRNQPAFWFPFRRVDKGVSSLP